MLNCVGIDLTPDNQAYVLVCKGSNEWNDLE